MILAGCLCGSGPVAASGPTPAPDRSGTTSPTSGAPAGAPHLEPSRPIVGEQVDVSGRFARRLADRRVVLQWHTRGRWRPVVSGRTTATGRYRLRITAPSEVRRLRAVVRGRDGTRSRVVRLRPLGQRLDSTLFASGILGEEATLRVVARPTRPGRGVVLQRRAGGTWEPMARSSVPAAGDLDFALPTSTTGTTSWRVRLDRHRGAPAVASAPVPVTTRPLRGTLDTVAADGSTFRVSVHSADDPVRVDVLVDGRSAGDATYDDRTGAWELELDTSGLAPGTHWVTGRLVKGAARGFTTAAKVEIVADPDEPSGLPDGFSQSVVAAGFDQPTSFALLGPRRALVAEKGGQVWLVSDGVRGAEPVIDLSTRVATEQDRGLLGLTVDPDFDAARVSGWVYLAYVVDDGSLDRYRLPQVVTRIRLVDGRRTGAEETVLGVPTSADCPQPDTPDCLPSLGFGHTVGDLAFGPDGDLYVGVGDGVVYWGDVQENIRAQQVDVLAGKVLRIDPETGLGLPGNPFYQAGGGPEARNRNRVFAYGLRNPFRFHLDPDSGAILIGDVGGSDVEEINRATGGENFGWPCYEGTGRAWVHDPRPGCAALYQAEEDGEAPVVWPLHGYPHQRLLGSITAGVPVPAGWPAALADRFVYADYSFGQIRTVDLDAPDPDATVSVFARDAAAGTPVKFADDGSGGLWYLSIFPGELRRVVHDDAPACGAGTFTVQWFADPDDDSEVPTETTCQVEPTTAGAPEQLADSDYRVRWSGQVPTGAGRLELSVTAPGRLRLDVDGQRLVDQWADQPVAADVAVDVAAGDRRIVMEHLHRAGAASPALTWALAGTEPVVVLTGPEGGSWSEPGAPVPYEITATDAEDGDVAASARLRVELVHWGEDDYHVHPYQDLAGAEGTVVLAPDHAPGHSVFRLTASAVDGSGRVGRSAPVYACLTGNLVGPCE